MARGGAAVAYDRISRAVPRPSDFDAFWKTKLAEIANLPLNPALEKGDCEKPGVDYWKIKLDNVNGTHVQGQLARPSGTQKLPALLIVQYAGVYPLQKSWAVDHAAAGWLTLNVMAHDLPIDRPKSFYAEQAQNELKDYTTIGKTDRDKTYFLRMFLGDLQAAKYLEQRPDWDGKTLVVTGGSQGGMQSFAVAALDQKVTGMVVIVPAGADDSGALAGRNPGWPFHLVKPEDPTEKQVLQAISYYDPVNFASLIKCPALVAVGLIDEVAPPTGVFTAFNQLQGPKEILVMARSNHTGAGGTQAAFKVRSNEWFAALAAGKPAPVRAAQP
jgi:cephalosporin-C deacetylase-like acetyl esterase